MEIEDLYDLLPGFQCIEGCIECCRSFGVPSSTRIEAERIRDYLSAMGMEPKYAHGTTCPYVSDAGCTIYPVRPLICRLYGGSPSYRCFKGARPVRLLHPDEEEEIFNFYRENFF